MIRNLAAIAFIGTAMGFILYQLWQFFAAINNPKSKLIADLKSLREELMTRNPDLINLDMDEFQRLSGEISRNSSVSIASRHGSIHSIFNENLVHYIVKNASIEDTKLIRFLAANLDLGIIQQKNTANVYQDGILLGSITNDYQISNSQGDFYGAILAFDNSHLKIVKNDVEVAKMVRPSQINVAGNTRILSEIQSDLLLGDTLLQSAIFYYMLVEFH